MSWRTFPRPAVIVAESLRRLPEPPFVAGPPPLEASAAAVAAAIARSLAPPAAVEPAPAWLRESQRVTFARALAAIRKFSVALVADPVGSGNVGCCIHDVSMMTDGPTWCQACRTADLEIWTGAAAEARHQHTRRGRIS